MWSQLGSLWRSLFVVSLHKQLHDMRGKGKRIELDGLFRRTWSGESPFIPHHKLKRHIKKVCVKVAIVVFNSTKTNVKGLITEE